MTPARVGCRDCGRPVPDDSPCGCCCWNHDDAPSPARRWFPSAGTGIAVTCAALLLTAGVGVLAQQFDRHYDVIPTPDGPAVIHVQEDAP